MLDPAQRRMEHFQREAGSDILPVVRRLVLGWLVLALSIAIAVRLLPGVDVDGGLSDYLWIAVLFGVINALLGPLLRLVTLPLKWLTLGLFTLVLNGVLFALTGWLSDSLTIDDFPSAVLAAAVISVVGAVFQFFVMSDRDKEH